MTDREWLIAVAACMIGAWMTAIVTLMLTCGVRRRKWGVVAESTLPAVEQAEPGRWCRAQMHTSCRRRDGRRTRVV